MTVTDVLAELGVEYREGGTHSHVTQGWVGVDCPGCSPGLGKFKLGINLAWCYGSCWTCGHVHLVEALAASSGVPFGKVRSLLEGLVREDLPQHERPTGRLVLPKGVGPLLPVHRKYLESRRLSPTVVENLWGVGGVGLAVQLAWSLFIPVHHKGRVVSWTTRSVHPSGGYRNAKPEQEERPAKSCLYGGDLARHTAVVVEGPVDAWAIGPGAVATLGVGYTKAQLLALSRFPVRVVCFDAETDARVRARQLAADLSAFPGVTHRTEFESGKDASRADQAEVNELRKKFLE
jgi:hypothetical protein